jgi:hypothetical protein
MTAAASASRVIGLVKGQTFLHVDERPEATTRIFGYRGQQLLLLAEPGIAYRGEHADALVSRFVANLRRCRPRLAKATCDQARLLIATAASCAMEDPAAASHGNIAFVLAYARGEVWRVITRGAFDVWHLGQREMREVLAGSQEMAEAAPGARCDADVRVAEVQLASGEALLAMPEPPADLDEVRQLAERLAATGGRARGDAAISSRSFFAVRRA